MPPKKAPSKSTSKAKAIPSKAPATTKPSSITKKPTEKAAPVQPSPVRNISLKQLANVLLTDVDGTVKESGKWPLVIDESENAATFLKYRDVNYVNTIDPGHIQPDRLRLALLGAIWFGKPLVLDMGDADMIKVVTEKFDEVEKGLMDSVFDRSILTEERVLKLVRKPDGEMYESRYLDESRFDNFKLVILTKIEPEPSLGQRMYLIKIV